MATTAALALSGCNSGQGGDETSTGAAPGGTDGSIELVYLQKQGDSQYFVDQAQGAREMATELGNVTVTVVNLGTDSNKAISEVDTALARGVDGVIMVAPDQAIGPQVIEKTSAAGVPLLASDDVLTDADGAEAPFVGFNGTQMGNSIGEKAAELYTNEDWTVENTRILSVGKMDLSVCVQRLEGAAASFTGDIADSPEIIDLGTDNSVTGALDKTSAVVTANQGVQNWVVWGCNDESETGAVTALQNAGVAPDAIIGVGLGAYLTCKDWAAGQDSGNKAALYISGYDVGSAAVEAMVTALRDGASLPAETIATTHMVDATNWEEQGVSCT